MKPIHYLLFLLLFIFSCKKEDCRRPDTTVSGTVVDEQTLQPMPDVAITLIWKKCKRGFLGTECSDITVKESEKTDLNGNFELKFCKIHDEKDYKIKFEKWGYYTTSPNLDYVLNNNVISLRK